MRKGRVFPWLIPALAAAALAAAAVPAEVLADLQFFSDFEIVEELDLIEGSDFPAPGGVSVSTSVPSGMKVSTGPASVALSTMTVKISSHSWRDYEKK